MIKSKQRIEIWASRRRPHQKWNGMNFNRCIEALSLTVAIDACLDLIIKVFVLQHTFLKMCALYVVVHVYCIGDMKQWHPFLIKSFFIINVWVVRHKNTVSFCNQRSCVLLFNKNDFAKYSCWKITRPTNLHTLRKFKLPSGRLACMEQQAFMGTFMDSILIKMFRWKLEMA